MKRRIKFTGMKSKIIGIMTSFSVIRCKGPHNNDIFFRFIQKTPEKILRTLYIGSFFSGIRSKATGIRSKIPQYDDDFSNPNPNIFKFYRSVSTLKKCVKTRNRRNYHTNVTLFRTLDQSFEILPGCSIYQDLAMAATKVVKV